MRADWESGWRSDLWLALGQYEKRKEDGNKA